MKLHLAALTLVLAAVVGCGDGSDAPSATPTARPFPSFVLPTEPDVTACLNGQFTQIPCPTETPTPAPFCDGRPCGTPSPLTFPTDRYGGGIGCVVIGKGQVVCPTPTPN